MTWRFGIAVFLCFFILTAGVIDLNHLLEYEDQPVPSYITQDNQELTNSITNAGATLGRVLFYDKRLSLNNSISCASCHIQEFAFSDTAVVSQGFDDGVTGRHSMRLVNHRFSEGSRAFWDQRARDLEDQSTQPIKDFVEMGFSGELGQPGLDSLFSRMSGIPEYQRLFAFVFGDEEINEERIQRALAQFVRSIQSFDSKFDEGLAATRDLMAPFPNFTEAENRGKMMFLSPPNTNNYKGVGCQACHRAPEFDIDPNSMNNGVIGVAADPTMVDLDNTRSPSLRDLINPQGVPNGPFMHNGGFQTLEEVIDHYNEIPFDPSVNLNLDRRLQGGPGQGGGQRLNLTNDEKEDLISFLKTLTGSQIYTDKKYSNPFQPDGKLVIHPLLTGLTGISENQQIVVSPNPVSDYLRIPSWSDEGQWLLISNVEGQLIINEWIGMDFQLDVSNLTTGFYLGKIYTRTGEQASFSFVKE